jgi:hypothetical protein
MARTHRTLTLDLDDGPEDSIGGRLSTEAGDAIEFNGWLGLAGALETALQSAPSDAEPALEATDEPGRTDSGRNPQRKGQD